MIEMIMMIAFMLLVVGALTHKPSLFSIKERIRQDMWNPLSARRNNRGEKIGDPWWLDCFKGLINGDYAEEHYKKWLKRFNDAVFITCGGKMKKDSTGWPYMPSKRLKSAVIEAFQVVMALEYGCTRGHFVKCLKAAVDTDIINEMTYLLMRAAIDHINEHVDDESKTYHVWISSDDTDSPRIYEAGCN